MALVVSLFPAAAFSAATASVSIGVSAALFFADPAFLGVTIDSASLTNGIDLGDSYLTTLAAQLSNASGTSRTMHLRVGGSASNGLVYVPSGVPGRCAHGLTCVTDSSLSALNAFAERTRMCITFCLPYQTDRSGRWNPDINASALWAAARVHQWTAFCGWSLGNEIIGTPGFDVAGYAQDYVAFRAAVSAQAPGWAQDIVGPSAAGFPGDAVIDLFLDSTASVSNLSLSLHAYSFKNCSLAAYLERAGMDRMEYYYGAFAAARDARAPNLPIYAEEIATQAGGGCEGLSNRFVSGFWFLRALGLAGEARVARVTRQDLAGWSFTSGVSHYALAGPSGWNSSARDGPPTPHPDYFAALLWRQLIGSTVLSVNLVTSPPSVNDTLAAHAWCANGAAGAIALVYINTAAAGVALALTNIAQSPRVEYFMTAPGGNLTADAALLNGALLEVDADGRLPAQPLPGNPKSGAIALPPYSYGFIIFPQAGASACTPTEN